MKHSIAHVHHWCVVVSKNEPISGGIHSGFLLTEGIIKNRNQFIFADKLPCFAPVGKQSAFRTSFPDGFPKNLMQCS